MNTSKETCEITTQVANRKKVGEAALQLLEFPDDKQGVVDTAREMLKSYLSNLIDAAQSGKELFGTAQPYYVCVQTRRERTMVNVIRSQFYCRQTRPLPAYDLALYWFDPKTEDLQFVWCIPDKGTTEVLAQHYPNVHKDDEQLAWFCKCFVEGTLI